MFVKVVITRFYHKTLEDPEIAHATEAELKLKCIMHFAFYTIY